MTGRRLRNLLLLAAVAAIAWWIYRDRPTVPGLVDRVTDPLLETNAAVQESEHKRVEAEAAPVIDRSQDATIAALHEGMTKTDVREALGPPDAIDEIRLKDRKVLIRWTYRRAGRLIDFDEGRVVSIAVR